MKNWKADIEKKIKELSKTLKPRDLDWWPKYVYHSTDVNNAVKILETGYLYSRIEAGERGLMIVDNASPMVIDGTSMDCMQFARLYFRPRTPTQYRNEGIRPIIQRSLESHSPVPIFFCFDALEVLCMDKTKFSNGNTGRSRHWKSDQRDCYLAIPFHHVFHEGSFTEDQGDIIIFHRNAEVLVPNSLQIQDNLKYIICRSPAELQTLLTLLPIKVAKEWKDLMHIDNKNRFFYRYWTFVDSVLTTPNTLTFHFNPNTITPGPFNAKVTYTENGKTPRSLERQNKCLCDINS